MLKKPQSVHTAASGNSAAALPELLLPSGCEVPELDLHTSPWTLIIFKSGTNFCMVFICSLTFNIPCMYFRGIQTVFHYFIKTIKYVGSSFIVFKFSLLRSPGTIERKWYEKSLQGHGILFILPWAKIKPLTLVPVVCPVVLLIIRLGHQRWHIGSSVFYRI